MIDVNPAIPYGPDGLTKLVSTRKDTLFELEWPALSTTVTFTVCVPSESPLSASEVAPEERVCADPPSTRTSM